MGGNIAFWKLPKELNGLIKEPGLILHSVVAVEGGSLELTLETKQVAFYIFLASSLHGDFDDNAFSMAAGSRRVCKTCINDASKQFLSTVISLSNILWLFRK